LAGKADMIKLDPPYDLRSVARENQFLPVVYDMGGFLVILLTGKIGWIDMTPPHSWKEETDPRIIRMAQYTASEKYSELSSLKPMRPENAIECKTCEGEGKIDHPSNAYACYCGGLGWLLPGE